MLELRAGKNRIFIKAASLMLAQMLLFTGLTYAVENSLNNSLRVPMKFAADSGKNIHNFIIEEMQKQGNRLTNAQFMEVALFHPKSGYYTTQPRIGIGQDFETAASDPLFGIDMARQIAQMWESMDRPKDFKIVEIGAGTGTLAKRILDHMKYRFPAFYDTLQYIIVDISPGLKNQQREILKDYQDKVRQIEGTAFDLSRLNNITGAFISNELPDAFPVHRITVDKEGDFREIYVTWKEGRYQEELGDISDPGIAEYISMVVQEGVELKSGMELPVNLGLFKWQQELSRSLAKGYIITVDYGGKSKDIYSQDKPAVWGGKARRLDMPSIYDYLSRGIAVDITSLVDFGIIAKAGEQRGIDAIDMLTQQAFMSRIENREAYPRQAGFCVLIQSKGIGTNNKLASNATILGYLRQLELDEKKKVSELDGDMTQEWQIWDERDMNGNLVLDAGHNSVKRTRSQHVWDAAKAVDFLIQGYVSAFIDMDRCLDKTLAMKTMAGTLYKFSDKLAKLRPESKEIFIMAAALHDYGYLEYNRTEPYEILGARYAYDLLEKQKKNLLVLEAVSNIIAGHNDIDRASGDMLFFNSKFEKWINSLVERGMLKREEVSIFSGELKYMLIAITLADIQTSGDRHLNASLLNAIIQKADGIFEPLDKIGASQREVLENTEDVRKAL